LEVNLSTMRLSFKFNHDLLGHEPKGK
jgi:hypothetical protein